MHTIFFFITITFFPYTELRLFICTSIHKNVKFKHKSTNFKVFSNNQSAIILQNIIFTLKCLYINQPFV